MNVYFLQFVLGRGNDKSGDIVELLIFVVFIVAMLLKNIFISKKQKEKEQEQKKPISRTSSQRTAASFEKATIQRERVEHFLESILQPKNFSNQHPSKPVAQKPQTASSSIPVPAKVTPSPKSFTNKTFAKTEFENVQAKSSPIIETSLGASIMDLPTIETKLEAAELKEEPVKEVPENIIYHNRPYKDKVSGKKAFGLLPVFSDSDDLKRAILYSEILGKPLSIRESQTTY
ncbi:MAG: hypothetical protein JW787_12790 [Sedimentisphaerales bacterium]|nr:hypothetical protein [Sedimentisphaerales bacterium]